MARTPPSSLVCPLKGGQENKSLIIICIIVYVDLDAVSIENAATLQINLNGDGFERSWRLKVTQLPCNSAYEYD